MAAAKAKTRLASPTHPPASAKKKAPKASPTTAVSPGKYVYCVIHADGVLGFGPLGIGVSASEVHTVLAPLESFGFSAESAGLFRDIGRAPWSLVSR